MIPSRTLTDEDASIALALIRRGVMQHDVATLLSVNPGRIAEIATRQRHRGVEAADLSDPSTRVHALELFRDAISRLTNVSETVLAP